MATFVPNKSNANPLPPTYQTLTDSGAITVTAGGKVFLNGTTIAATLPAPDASVTGATIVIQDVSGSAHTVTVATPGFNSGGTASLVATFAGNIGEGFEVTAFEGRWQVLNYSDVTGVTFAGS